MIIVDYNRRQIIARFISIRGEGEGSGLRCLSNKSQEADFSRREIDIDSAILHRCIVRPVWLHSANLYFAYS